jgi:hypothetical protein
VAAVDGGKGMKARFIPVGRVYLKEMSPMGYRLLLFIIRRIDEGEISSDGEKNIRIHLNESLM